MLQVDLSRSDREIEQAIIESCAELGRVTSVKVHRSPSPFALIEMSGREQSYGLTAKYGGSNFGTCALVHLTQKS